MKTSVFGDNNADKVVPYEEEREQQDVVVEKYVVQTKEKMTMTLFKNNFTCMLFRGKSNFIWVLEN